MSTDEIIEQAISGHASTRDAIHWAIIKEREECLLLCDKVQDEAYKTFSREMDYYDDGVAAGALACVEEIERRDVK